MLSAEMFKGVGFSQIIASRRHAFNQIFGQGFLIDFEPAQQPLQQADNLIVDDASFMSAR